MVMHWPIQFFRYSNQKNRNLINQMIQDDQIVMRRKRSESIEDILLQGLLTDNRMISFWIQCLYTGKWSTGEVLSSVFDHNASGSNFSSLKMDLRSLIRFALQEQQYLVQTELNTEPIRHYIEQCQSMIKRFEQLAENEENPDVIRRYHSANNSLIEMIMEVRTKQIDYKKGYQLILDNWDELYLWSIPFKLLSDLATMQVRWRDTPKSRWKLSFELRHLIENCPEYVE